LPHDDGAQHDEASDAHDRACHKGGKRLQEPVVADLSGGDHGQGRGGDGDGPATDGDELELAKRRRVRPALEAPMGDEVAEGRDRQGGNVGGDRAERCSKR
jgi:hypothetical protein